jgi:hypothetical protein
MPDPFKGWAHQDIALPDPLEHSLVAGTGLG